MRRIGESLACSRLLTRLLPVCQESKATYATLSHSLFLFSSLSAAQEAENLHQLGAMPVHRARARASSRQRHKESAKWSQAGEGVRCRDACTLGNYDLNYNLRAIQMSAESLANRESRVGNRQSSMVEDSLADSHIKTSYFASTHTHMHERVHASKCACEFHVRASLCLVVCVLPTRRCCSCTKGLHTHRHSSHTHSLSHLHGTPRSEK